MVTDPASLATFLRRRLAHVGRGRGRPGRGRLRRGRRDLLAAARRRGRRPDAVAGAAGGVAAAGARPGPGRPARLAVGRLGRAARAPAPPDRARRRRRGRRADARATPRRPPPTCRSAARRPPPSGCWPWTRSPSPRSPPGWRPTIDAVADSRPTGRWPAPPPPIPSSTSSPRSTPHGRTGSLPPDHNLDDYVDALRARPPARRSAAGRPRRPGRLGQDRAGRGAVPDAGRRVRPRRRHQRHLHDRGRRLPPPQRRPPRRPDRGGADRLLPAHRDPRRHHRQPRRRRAARGAAPRPGAGARRVRRRQPDRVASATGSSTCRSSSSTSPAGTRCRARAGPASPPPTCSWSTRPTSRRWSAPTSTSCAATPRPSRNGKPTHLISLREDPTAASVAEWVREQVRARALQTA